MSMRSDESGSPRWENLPKLEGPAFASIIAFLCGLAFQFQLEVFTAACIWFVFTVFCGLYIEPLQYKSKKELFLYCTLPAACLVVTWGILPILGIIFGSKGGWFRPTDDEWDFLLKLRILVPIVFSFTVAAIWLWAVGKRPLLQFLGADPARLDQVITRLQKMGFIGQLIILGAVYVISTYCGHVANACPWWTR